MMKASFLFFFIFFAFFANAQSVSLKKDVIYRDDQPYCKLVKTSSLIPRFSIRNLADEELAVAKFSNEEQRYTITFLGSGQQCYMSGTMGFGKILAKDIVNSNLIIDNKISPEGERRFLLEHNGGTISPGGTVYTPPYGTSDGTTDRYQIIERDRTKMLMIFGNKLSQDNVTVGSYSVHNTTAYGRLVKVFSFLLPSGEKIADAYVDGINARSARLIILKNNQTVTIGLKTFDDMSIAKDIANYLVGRYFL